MGVGSGVGWDDGRGGGDGVLCRLRVDYVIYCGGGGDGGCGSGGDYICGCSLDELKKCIVIY